MSGYRFFHSTRRADLILSFLEDKLYSETTDQSIIVFPYHNGRECGWDLRLRDLSIKFSENRDSDQLVVYVDRDHKYEYNLPTEKSYNERRLFNTYEEAANYIVETIEG